MRIGIVAYWFNRGQGVVARQLRSALDELGHQTAVLARPTRETNIRPSWIDHEDVWDQPGVTDASDYLIPRQEYERWAEENELELALFDQNYQFEEIASLRGAGVRTVGRFVWEHFAPEHVEPARQAFDVVYSLTLCEQRRYRELGIDSPYVQWGCHPELLGFEPPGQGHPHDPAPPVFFFPGGFMGARKPVADVLTAFRRADDHKKLLFVKAQVERRKREVRRMLRGGRLIGRRDRRVTVIWKDLPTADYLRLFSGCDVCLAPSRWEGLGLHLYEATAFAMPVITNDNPPMNEVVRDGVNGLLVRGIPDGEAPRSGIPAFRPDVDELAGAIERICDPDLYRELRSGAERVREERRWERTVAALGELVAPRSG